MKVTPNYILPQLEGNDFFDREALNDGFKKIDLAINDLQETFNSTADGGALVVQEVIGARGEEGDLKVRIERMDSLTKSNASQLDTIADENIKLLDSIGNYKVNSVIGIELIRNKQVEYLTRFYEKKRAWSPFIIDCQGDSMTYGTGNDNGVQFFDEHPTMGRVETPYPLALQNFLRQIYGNITTVTKHATPGDTVKVGYSRYKDSPNADLCLLMYGINDSGGTGDASYAKDYQQFIYYYEQLIIRRILQGQAVILLTPTKPQKVNADTVIPYEIAIEQLGKKYNCPVINTRKFTINYRSNIYSDDVHFNSEGYKVFASRIASVILSNNPFDVLKVSNGTELLFRKNADNITWGTNNDIAINGVANGKLPAEHINNVNSLYNYLAKDTKLIYSFETTEDNMIVYFDSIIPNGATFKMTLDFDVQQADFTNDDTVLRTRNSTEMINNSISLLGKKEVDKFTINKDGNWLVIPKSGLHTITVENSVYTSEYFGIGFLNYNTLYSNNRVGYLNYPITNNLTTFDLSFDEIKHKLGYDMLPVRWSDSIDIPIQLTLYTLGNSVIKYLMLLGADNGTYKNLKEYNRKDLKESGVSAKTISGFTVDWVNKKITLTLTTATLGGNLSIKIF